MMVLVVNGIVALESPMQAMCVSLQPSGTGYKAANPPFFRDEGSLLVHAEASEANGPR